MKLLFFASMILASINTYGQEHLDVSKIASCELFPEKENYDVQKRIEEINTLENKTVTVFMVKGKDLKITNTYSGIVKIQSSPDLKDKARASVLVVETDLGNGRKSAYFPLTDDKSYRIYLTGCMERK